MVDALSEAFFSNRLIIAADWRGYGKTTGAPVDNYWFPDYLADLDFLLDHYAGDKPVDLVGHSMGGNVVMMYAGSRPERVRRLINLEGFGMPVFASEKAPSRYAQWMDELKKLHRGELDLTAYDKADGVARRLMKTNPRLGRDEAGKAKANWLATHWAAENAQGKWEILGDPAHKIVNANLWNVAETLASTKTSPHRCWWWRRVMTHLAAGGTANSRWMNSMNVSKMCQIAPSKSCKTPAT